MNPDKTTIEPRDYFTVLSHFYRGELGRIMEWRRRLDITTNWAIMGATAMISFGFGAAEDFSLPFIFANYLVFLLLVIEARRYRIYDAFRARVRALEVNFILPVMRRDPIISRGEWEEALGADLLSPGSGLGAGTAVLRRFRRNYVWIFLLIAVAWFAKAWIHSHRVPGGAGFSGVLGAPATLPGVLFWAMAGLLYAAVLGMVIAVLFFSRDSFRRNYPPCRPGRT